MRKKIVAANWKMNLNFQEAHLLLSELSLSLPILPEHVQVIVCPNFLYLSPAIQKLNSKPGIFVGAQNAHQENSGAFTGETSPEMLKSIGVSHVILGHSERRQYFHETENLLKNKVDKAYEVGLEIIFCCGEPLEVRENNRQNDFVENQLKASLFHLNNEQIRKVSIAYEPIWAIGTGRTATSEQAQEMHAHLRKTLTEKYGEDVAQLTSILYGGSAKASNAAELFAQPDVDGGLIGGASLLSAEFVPIVQARIDAG